jgi:hypothetical protein
MEDQNTMAGRKTRDGVRLNNILDAAREIGVAIRTGTKHPYVLSYDGLRPCPVATSTDARKMVVPWIMKTGNYTPRQAYNALRNGSWS